jgi:hypothetical protein
MDLKNRFRKDSSSDIDYSVKTIWNTTGKLLQEKCHDEYKLTFNPFCDVVPNVHSGICLDKLFVIKSKFSEKMGNLVILFLTKFIYF